MNKEKSPMEIWAENEIRIACERERAGADGDEWDYGVACYESALKAFKSLLEDGHSGMSIGITKGILNALIDGKVLTPIENTEGVWEEVRTYVKGCKRYQCKRMSSLFKYVYDDGRVQYSDVNRFVAVDNDNPVSRWHNGHVDKIAGELLPIQFPYVPKTYKVYCEEHLTDRKNGDFDTLAILFVEDENRVEYDIYRYFKEAEEGWEEISNEEWNERVQMHKKRKINEQEKVI